MRSSQRLYDLFLSGVALAIGVVVSLAAIEVASRTVLDDGMNFDLEMWKYAKDIKRVSPIEGLGHDHIPGSSGLYMGVPVDINSAGYRDREHPIDKQPGSVRIMMIGDSLTFGWGVKVEDTVAKKLETRLGGRSDTPAIEVINAGVGNYNSAMEVLEFVRRGSGFNPDIVVLNYFINDAEPTPKRKETGLLEHSYGAVFAAGKIDALQRMYFGKGDWKDYYSNLYTDDSQTWRDTSNAIAALADYCRTNGIRLLIANYPELHQLAPYPFAPVTQRLERLAQSLDVPFVDLLPAIADAEPETLWVSPTDAHPNAKATEAFADVLEQALITILSETVTH